MSTNEHLQNAPVPDKALENERQVASAPRRKSNQTVRAAMLVFIGLDLGNAGPVTSHAGDEHGFVDGCD